VGLGAELTSADDVALALTPDGRLVVGVAQREKEGWQIAVLGCTGRLEALAEGPGTLAGGLRATDEEVAFMARGAEPEGPFLPHSARLRPH
jgi:hypothetical protein